MTAARHFWHGSLGIINVLSSAEPQPVIKKRIGSLGAAAWFVKPISSRQVLLSIVSLPHDSSNVCVDTNTGFSVGSVHSFFWRACSTCRITEASYEY